MQIRLQCCQQGNISIVAFDLVLSFDDDLESTLDVSIDLLLRVKVITLFGVQAGLAKLIGLAGETNIQAGFMSLSNLNLSFYCV